MNINIEYTGNKRKCYLRLLYMHFKMAQKIIMLRQQSFIPGTGFQLRSREWRQQRSRVNLQTGVVHALLPRLVSVASVASPIRFDDTRHPQMVVSVKFAQVGDNHPVMRKEWRLYKHGSGVQFVVYLGEVRNMRCLCL